MRPQTPQTIGPCRRTRTSRAAPSRRLTKHSSSSPSVSSPESCKSAVLRTCWMTLFNWVDIDSHPQQQVVTSHPPLLHYRHEDGLMHDFRIAVCHRPIQLLPLLIRP